MSDVLNLKELSSDPQGLPYYEAIAETIKSQLLTLGRTRVMSWGTYFWGAIGTGLLFSVDARCYSGHIFIELDVDQDLYNIHFGKFSAGYKNCWKNVETIEGMCAEQLVDLIDEKIEKIGAYRF
jgi:hypothetical protein